MATPAVERPATITVGPRDLAERRARIHYSPEAKIKLAHMAGAPWSERDPDATLHPLQRECLARGEREKIIHGASRIGKSVLGGAEALIEAMLPGSKTAIVAARYDHVAHEFQYVHTGMVRLFGDHPQVFKRLSFRHSQNYHDYECDTIWGSNVRGFSTDSDEGAALLGQEFNRVVLGEGSHISADILEKKIMRAIDGALMKGRDGVQEETGYLSIYTTPTGYEGCSAFEFERVRNAGNGDTTVFNTGKVPFAETVWIREANVLENPAYDRAVYEARRKSLSKAAFEEQYQGKMTWASGRIYQEYDEDRHRRPRPSPDQIREMRLGVGMDTGAYFGASLVGVDQSHVGWALGEVYTQKQTINTSCDQVREMIVTVLGPAFGIDDFVKLANRMDLWVADPASQHKMELMDLLEITLSSPTRGEGKFDLIPTIDQMREFFRNGRFLLCDDLIWTHDQIRKYIWKTFKPAGVKSAPTIKEPRKVDDHLLDSLRFIAIPLMESGPLDVAPAPLTLQEAWAQHQRERIHGPLKKLLNEARWRPMQC